MTEWTNQYLSDLHEEEQQAVVTLIECRKQYRDVLRTTKKFEAKFILHDEEYALLKNAEMRKAAIDEYMGDYQDQVDIAKHNLDKAELAYESIRFELRCLELATK